MRIRWKRGFGVPKDGRGDGKILAVLPVVDGAELCAGA